MEGVNPIKSQEATGHEKVLVPPIRETVPKKAAGEPKKMEPGDQAKIERVAQAMENYVKSTQRNLRIQVHNGTGNIMVKVISKEDGQVIREIPPEELLNLAAKMEAMTGVLFNENA